MKTMQLMFIKKNGHKHNNNYIKKINLTIKLEIYFLHPKTSITF